MIDLVDTHCHPHELIRKISPTHDRWFADHAERTFDSMLQDAANAGIHRLICVGTSLADSVLAVEAAEGREGVFACIGIHPHEASGHKDPEVQQQFSALLSDGDFRAKKIVAIGECGLDYYYGLSPKADQAELLRFQIELALTYDLPLNFHVRDAFDDFWPIFDSYQGIRGVLHSFTDSAANLEKALERGLMIGVNGISTFARNEAKIVIYRTIPQHSLLLETDAPYLTPVPYRGKICESKHIRTVAEFLSELRGESLEELAAATTANAERLFTI